MPTQPIVHHLEDLSQVRWDQGQSSDHPATDLDKLHAGELAVAIHAAGIPKNWRSLSPVQAGTLALSGLMRLGLAEIRRLDRIVRAANLACIDKERRYGQQVDVSAEEKPLLAVWKSHRAAQTAADLAFRVISRRQAFDDRAADGAGHLAEVA